MIFLHKTPFFRLTAALVAGILSYRCGPAGEISLLFFGLGAGAMAAHRYSQTLGVGERWSRRWQFGLAVMLLLMSLGRTAAQYEQACTPDHPAKSTAGEWMAQTRQHLFERFERYTTADTNALLQALVLGNKQQLRPEHRQVFTQAGCAHILAVSGLHVGIVFAALRLLCRRPSKKRGIRLLQAAIQLGGLWTYALLCGLPPSVTRSALMFSVIAVGYCFNERPDTCNSVFFSAFVLLIYQPSLLYNIGFQLSYSAVLGILAFAGPLQRLYEPSTWLGGKILALEAVSVAAQLATAPFCLYYFKSFPVYFPLSNLIAVPAATCLLYLGIGLLLTGGVDWAGQMVGQLLDGFYLIFFDLLSSVSHLPYATLHTEWFTLADACLLGIILPIIFVRMQKNF